MITIYFPEQWWQYGKCIEWLRERNYTSTLTLDLTVTKHSIWTHIPLDMSKLP